MDWFCIIVFSYEQNESNQTTTGSSFGSELCAKLSTDQWIIGKLVDQREVYIVVAVKNSNLVEIMEEVDKLISAEFRNVCLLEKWKCDKKSLNTDKDCHRRCLSVLIFKFIYQLAPMSVLILEKTDNKYPKSFKVRKIMNGLISFDAWYGQHINC